MVNDTQCARVNGVFAAASRRQEASLADYNRQQQLPSDQFLPLASAALSPSQAFAARPVAGGNFGDAPPSWTDVMWTDARGSGREPWGGGGGVGQGGGGGVGQVGGGGGTPPPDRGPRGPAEGGAGGSDPCAPPPSYEEVMGTHKGGGH